MKTIAITIGDINGIGPEVALKAVYNYKWPRDLNIILIGNYNIITEQVKALGYKFSHYRLNSLEEIKKLKSIDKKNNNIFIYDHASKESLLLKRNIGKITPEAAFCAVEWIKIAVKGCIEKYFSAMVTAPISKEGLKKVGLEYHGHTEILAALCNRNDIAMMFTCKKLNLILVTRHIAIKNVASELKKEKIEKTISFAYKALKLLGVNNPKIVVCALNPHAGDGGAIGEEEINIITPAIKNAKKEYPLIFGPIPADVVFYNALHNREYNAIVAMYHDQGLAPFKMLFFNKGVNLTLGLPIIRTSPDHGTAFDIADKLIADPSSMIEAIKLAYKLSKKDNPWQ